MTKFRLGLLLGLLCWTLAGLLPAWSQKVPEASAAERFFPRKDLMPVGAYYYPEAWPEARWERDIKRMAELGFEFIHMGEFAWAAMEPTEGNFTFQWLDKCVDIAGKAGLKVILCTPTPCPPAWLTTKYPEVLIYDDNGRQMQHGGRLHPSWSSPKYHELSQRIITELGKRYGKNPYVWGWQLDNEPSHGGAHYDYSPAAQVRFREWLKDKYKTLDRLNQDWGTSFWSNTYTDWAQIQIPNRKTVVAEVNPHQLLDFQRFNDAELTRFFQMQTKTLRQNLSPKQFITTNYAYYTFLPEINLFTKRETLDFASYTMYLLSTYLDAPKGELSHRLGSGLGLSFTGEFARSINGYSGVMELQPGQINWGAWNSQPLPGAVKMWLWHCFATGGRFACTYRFDRPIYGSELYHSAIMGPDGVTVDRGGAEYLDFIREQNDLKKKAAPGPAINPVYHGRRMGILWNSDNILDMGNHKQHKDWNTFTHIFKYYSAAKRAGAPVDFISEDLTLDPKTHPILVVPAYQLMEKSLVAKLEAYANAGGHLVLSTRTGQKDKRGQLHETKPQEIIWKLIGAQIDWFDHLPSNLPGTITMGNQAYKWYVWGEKLVPQAGTETWATFADQFYAGSAAVTHRKAGKGSVTYVGVDSEDGELENDAIARVYKQAGIPIFKHKPYFFTEYRDGCWVSVNYTSEVQTAPVSEKGKIWVGERQVKPGGVCVWTE